MDKYEYKVRLQEIKDLIAKGEYVEAASIADTIDWTKVKSVMMLCTISDLYKINRRLEDARDLLLLAYDRYPGGRSIVYSLCELFIKMGDVVQAVEYYKEFVQIAPKDTGRYILQYKLYEAQDVSIEERIEVLKELKSKEYIEKWAYELAYLYHRIGLATKCVEECDELILWFGEGRYVMKAMELKMLHEPLTPSQEEKYAEMKGEIVRQKAAEEAGEVYPEAPEEEKPEEEVDESPTKEILTSDPDDIQVKVMNVGQYDTINMQKELAANMKELWDQKTDKEPEAEGDTDLQETKRLDSLADALEDFTMAETKVIETDAVKEALNQSEEQGEVFFGETSEMTPVSAEESSAEITEETLEQPMEAPVQSGQSTVPEAAAPKAEEKQEAEEPQEEEPETVVLPAREIEEHINAQPVMKPRIAATIDPHKPLPEGMEKMLGMEYDGQISMVVPEAEQVEKQITGQISLEDVLAEWERVKKENEQKRMEEVQQHILQQTGAMFTEFEAATRDGLLEKLEKGKTIPSDEVEELEEYYEPAQEDGEDYEEPDAADADIEVEEEPDAADADTEVEEEPDATDAAAEAVEDDVKDAETDAVVKGKKAPGQKKGKPVRKAGKEQGRRLTAEEKELFGSYLQNKHTREQILNAIDKISLAAYTGNIILTGEEGMDTLTLAKKLMKEVQQTDSNFSGKIAKISSESLNKKGIAPVFDRIVNGALIIQKANKLSDDSVKDMQKVMNQEHKGMIVILEDTKGGAHKLLKKHPELKELFNIEIHVEALDNDSLVSYGRKYAEEQEYGMDEMGVLALHTCIAERQTIDHIVTIEEVKDIIDDAIQHANRKTLGHFFDIIVAKRYDEEDRIILRENDFR